MVGIAKNRLGIPNVRGNNDEVYQFTNSAYVNDTEANVDGLKHLPEGLFVELIDNDFNGVITTDGTSISGISGPAIHQVYFDEGIGGNNRIPFQALTSRAINIGVRFDDAEVGTGITGQTVYAAIDGTGLATLVAPATVVVVGQLKSSVQDDFYDSYGNKYAGANISFTVPQSYVLGSGGGTLVDAYTKTEADAKFATVETVDTLSTTVDTLTTTVDGKAEDSEVLKKDGSVTMDASYTPSADTDVVTKAYADTPAVQEVQSTKKSKY